jgi:hypothetical protein
VLVTHATEVAVVHCVLVRTAVSSEVEVTGSTVVSTVVRVTLTLATDVE